MPLFCDQCGEEFGENTLRADSKFCSYCGKALSDYVKQQCMSLFKSPSWFLGDGTPHSPTSAKKRKTTEGDLHDGGSQLNDSMDYSPSKGRNQPEQYSQVMIDENSTEADPETEGPENQVSSDISVLYSIIEPFLLRNWGKASASADRPDDTSTMLQRQTRQQKGIDQARI